jgi:hypothetical protein
VDSGEAVAKLVADLSNWLLPTGFGLRRTIVVSLMIDAANSEILLMPCPLRCGFTNSLALQALSPIISNYVK